MSPTLSARSNWWTRRVGRESCQPSANQWDEGEQHQGNVQSFKCFDPVDKKCFKRNADTPRKDRMAFTHDFPLKIPAKLLNNFHFMTHRYTMTYLMSFKEYSESFIYIYVITNSSYISIPVRPLYAAATYVLPILNSSSTSQCN